MSAFDLLLIVLLPASIAILSAATLLFIRGQRRSVATLLRAYVSGVAVYDSIVVAVSLIMPARGLRIGEPLCFDDWCITVDGVTRAGSRSAESASIVVALRMANRARRATQRERNLVVYLRDAGGNRHDPVANASSVPTDAVLAPGESVVTTRTFDLPRSAVPSGLVITHEGGFPIDWFIIGERPFRKKTMVRLDSANAP